MKWGILTFGGVGEERRRGRGEDGEEMWCGYEDNVGYLVVIIRDEEKRKIEEELLGNVLQLRMGKSRNSSSSCRIWRAQS